MTDALIQSAQRTNDRLCVTCLHVPLNPYCTHTPPDMEILAGGPPCEHGMRTLLSQLLQKTCQKESTQGPAVHCPAYGVPVVSLPAFIVLLSWYVAQSHQALVLLNCPLSLSLSCKRRKVTFSASVLPTALHALDTARMRLTSFLLVALLLGAGCCCHGAQEEPKTVQALPQGWR